MEDMPAPLTSSAGARGTSRYRVVKQLLRLLCLVALCGGVPVTFAQTNTGQIAGVVRDPSRAFIPGATVTATHLASHTQVRRVTDSAGAFLFPSLAVGEYTLYRPRRRRSPMSSNASASPGCRSTAASFSNSRFSAKASSGRRAGRAARRCNRPGS